MTSNSIKILLKFLFAFGLVYWLVSSGKLDFSILSQAIETPSRLLVGFAALFTAALITTWRWKYILEARSESKLNFFQMAKCNWIGLFFNTVLPGSVTGDFVKIVYLKDHDEKLTTKYLLGSVLLDRVIGLFGLIIMLGLFSLINYNNLSSISVSVNHLINLNLLLFSAVILGLFSLFYLEKVPSLIVEKLKIISFVHKVALNLLKVWDELCLIRKRIIWVIIASLFVHVLAVLAFWIMTAPFASPGDFDLYYAFSFVPIGFISIAIPIAPAGLGVGHAVFHELFKFFSIENGASLFNIFFFVQISVYLLGAIPYLISKPNLKKTNP